MAVEFFTPMILRSNHRAPNKEAFEPILRVTFDQAFIWLFTFFFKNLNAINQIIDKLPLS